MSSPTDDMPLAIAPLFMPDLTPYVTKRLFGRPRIGMGAFFTISGFMFESGVVLGCIFSANQLVFEKVMGQTHLPGLLVDHVRERARSRAVRHPNAGEPISTWFYKTEVARLRHNMELSSSKHVERLGAWIGKQHLELETAYEELQHVLYEGVGYGFEYPDEAIQLWKVGHEQPQDPENWREAYALGAIPLTIPFEPGDWEEHASGIKSVVTGFVQDLRPDLASTFEQF